MKVADSRGMAASGYKIQIYVVFLLFITLSSSYADTGFIAGVGGRVQGICHTGLSLFGGRDPESSRSSKGDALVSEAGPMIRREADTVEISTTALEINASPRLQLLNLLDVKNLPANSWVMGRSSKDPKIQIQAIVSVLRLLQSYEALPDLVEFQSPEIDSVEAYLKDLVETAKSGESLDERKNARLRLVALVRGVLSSPNEPLSRLRFQYRSQFERVIKAEEDWPKNVDGIPKSRPEELSPEESQRLSEVYVESRIKADIQNIIHWMEPPR